MRDFWVWTDTNIDNNALGNVMLIVGCEDKQEAIRKFKRFHSEKILRVIEKGGD